MIGRLSTARRLDRLNIRGTLNDRNTRNIRRYLLLVIGLVVASLLLTPVVVSIGAVVSIPSAQAMSADGQGYMGARPPAIPVSLDKPASPLVACDSFGFGPAANFGL